jgi:SpoVK/Ycf46/Vps4 family AAA+-type ATPase
MPVDEMNNTNEVGRKTLDDFLKRFARNEKTESVTNAEEQVPLHFDQQYIDLLEHESEQVAELCSNLNNDDHFIQALNLSLGLGDQSVEGYKAEHLFISDFIDSYNRVSFSENARGRFTLACFFERMQGKRLYHSAALARLNQMAENETFIENINKIKQAKYLDVAPEYKGLFLIPSILFKIGHPLFVRSGNIIYRFASLVAKSDGTISDDEKMALSKILEAVSNPLLKTPNSKIKEVDSSDTLEIVLSELNSMVGLDAVKKSVTELINLLKIQKLRSDKELDNIGISLHAIFIGPPGTGKTTVARLLGRIYKHLGFLSRGHLLETDRAGLVAGYVGQTALKVDEVISEAKGGVLFIDEAYSLVSPDNTRDFGSEAVDGLIKRMEDYRNDLAVIVAGYNEPMEQFIDSNPGLRSRFSRYFFFEHFTPDQLTEIFLDLSAKHDFVVSVEAKEKLSDTFFLLHEKRDDSFGNARVVRNLFERCVQNQANRLVTLPEISEQLLQTIEEADIPEPKK